MILFLVYFAIFSAAFVGFFVVLFEKVSFSRKIFPYLSTAAAGSFTAAFVHLLVHSSEHTHNPVILASFAMMGYFIFYLLRLIFSDAHHHHGVDKSSCSKQTSNISPLHIVIGDALHNIADGMVLAGTILVDKVAAIAAALGIFLHELVMQTSQFILLKEAGLSSKKAIFYSLLAQSSIFLGGILAFALYNSVENIAPAIMAATVGAFAYIVLNDLVPFMYKVLRAQKYHGLIIHLAVFAVGFWLVFVLRG